MKTSKFFNLAIIIMFITAITLPLFFINKMPGKISTAENRVLANFPALHSTDGNLNSEFIKQIEKWFNDNMGFRDRFVMINTLLQYKLFGKLTKTDNIIGKNEWRYYVTPEIIRDYQHLNIEDTPKLEQWTLALNRIHQSLKARHTPFITMLLPDKKTVYPENYPDTIYQIGNVARTDLFVKRIAQNNDLDFVYMKDILLAAKKQATVYSPRVDDAHWNNYGAFIGYLELMERVRKYFPAAKGLSWSDFEIAQHLREDKVYNTLLFSEMEYGFGPKIPFKAVKTQEKLRELNLTDNNNCHSYTNPDKTLPKALIFGDSYFYGKLIPYFAESFSELTFIHVSNVGRLASLVEKFKPDIVVFEVVERMMDGVMPLVVNAEKQQGYNDFSSLPIVDNLDARGKPVVWLDKCNDKQLQAQGKIQIDKKDSVIQISGWAIDPRANLATESIFVKVGEVYLLANFRTPRPDVADHFHNPQLVNSGFIISIDAATLKDADKISFIIIANDKTYQYKPVDYWIERK